MPTRAFGGIKIQVSVCGVGIWWSILSFVAKGCWDGRLPKAWKIAHLFFCEEKFQINIDFIYLFIYLFGGNLVFPIVFHMVLSCSHQVPNNHLLCS